MKEKLNFKKKDLIPTISFVSGMVAFPIFGPIPLFIGILKSLPDALPFINKQGEISKIDAEFITSIIEKGKNSGVSEINLEFSKDQITGLDTTINKVKASTGFDLDLGIKGQSNITLHVKYK